MPAISSAASSALAMNILENMEIAVLRRTAPLKYEAFGKIPRFYSDLFGKNILRPWMQSPMLEFFISDAEAFFQRGMEGQISSGIWREDGVSHERALFAIAMIVGGESILIVRSLDEDYVERVRILRKAREQLLAQRELRSDLELYKHKAQYDGLTGLFNRATLMDVLGVEIQRAYEAKKPFSFLLLDIDDFKEVNDTWGHLAGDAVLKSIGQILTRHLRRGDIAARYGGEELVVIAPETTLEQAKAMAEKLRGRIASFDFQLPRKITVSIGCTSYVDGENEDAVIARADIALYEAKRLTKNMVVVR